MLTMDDDLRRRIDQEATMLAAAGLANEMYPRIATVRYLERCERGSGRVIRSITMLSTEIAALEVERRELETLLESPKAVNLALAAPWRDRHRHVTERIEDLKDELLIREEALRVLEPAAMMTREGQG